MNNQRPGRPGMTAAQAAQQNNRDTGGQYASKAHTPPGAAAALAPGDAPTGSFSGIADPEVRAACEEYATRYAPAPTSGPDGERYYPDWRRAHHESARNIEVGHRLATGRVVTGVDSTSSPGTVFIYTDGKTGPGRYDVWANHGDPIKVHDDRVDLSDPDWFENEMQRALAEKITEDAIITGRPASDEQVSEWDATIRNGLYRAYSRSDISPLSPTGDQRVANGRAKVGDDVIFEQPMHGSQAYRVLGKRAQVAIAGHDGSGVVWEENGEVEYVLKSLTSGQQTTSNLRGHGWRRIPAPGDMGPGARTVGAGDIEWDGTEPWS